MVVTRLPATLPTGTEHERIAAPSTSTVHAPHCATPQLNLVPVKPTESRITHKSGVSGESSTTTVFPLTFSFMPLPPSFQES
jgi:hypothetical protein